MASLSPILFFFLFTFLLLIGLASSSSFLSNEIFESRKFTGRTLLQNPTECKIDFQNKNYTIITSRCKGPIFPPKQCCDAFLEFACPFADAINDLKNECSVTMFTYINLYGKYPPGIFSNLCVGGQGGIDCPEESKVEKEKKEKEEKEKKKKKKSIGIKMGVTHSTLLIIIAANFLVIFLFHSF